MSQLKPQDIVLAIKLLTWPEHKWSFEALGKSLGIGHNQAHLAYKRLIDANLVNPELKRPIKQNLLEFITHGLKYVFPPEWRDEAVGIPIATSGPLLEDKINSGQEIVWPTKRSKDAIAGKGLEPIHESAVIASRNDQKCYEILSIIEAIRGGSARERDEASKIIKDLILGK